MKHNTTLCHHHIDTDYPTEISSDTYFDTLMEIIYFLALFIIPTAIMYGFMLLSTYLDNEYSLDQGGTFFFNGTTWYHHRDIQLVSLFLFSLNKG